MPSLARPSGRVRRRAALCGLLLAVASVPVPVRAVGMVFGLRAGVALPFGTIAGSGGSPELAQELRLAFPVQLQIDAVLAPGLLLGLYGQYAPAALSKRAPLGTSACVGFASSCSGASSRRVGLAIEHRLAAWGPWIGGAAGYAWTDYSFRDPAGPGSLTYRGFELSVQGGADFALAPGWSLGPMAAVTLGRFDRLEASQAGASLSGSIAEKSIHGWLQLGVRGRFEL